MGMVTSEGILGLSMEKIPLLRVTLALAIGIFIGQLIDIPYVSYMPVFITVLFIFILIINFLPSYSYRNFCFSLFLYLMLLIGGIWSIARHNPTTNIDHFSNFQGVQVVGIVADDPIYKSKTIRVPIQVKALLQSDSTIRAEGKLILTIHRDSLQTLYLNYGDKIIFKNRITEIQGPFNPNEFNHKKHFKNKGIWHQCYLTVDQLQKIGSGNGNYLVAKSLIWRQQLINKFSLYIHNSEAYQIAIALIFGYRSEVNASTLEAFTHTGTIHILSVSGLHVSLVFGLLSLILVWMDRFKYGRVYRCLLILFFIWLYVILTGMSPSILRAGIMISFFIVSLIWNRKQVPLNTLLASAFCILLLSPYYLFDVGFQLSYSAMLGIILMFPMLKKMWTPSQKWAKLLVEYCYVSIAAQLFTLPLALYYFGQFPVYFLFANLFIAVPSTVIMYLGISLVFIPFIDLAKVIGLLLNWILMFSLNSLKIIAEWPMALSEGILWNGIQALLLIVILILGIITFNYRHRILLYITLLFSFVLVSYSIQRRIRYDNYVGIRIYNVRQEVAIAQIDRGRVFLFSTVDSLQHATLKFSVLPDLKQYLDIESIHFVKLNDSKRHNYELVLGDTRILIVESTVKFAKEVLVDFVLWRRNNRSDINDLLNKFSGSQIIIDGSNTQKNIENLTKSDYKVDAIYLLKNNFAYVWDLQ